MKKSLLWYIVVAISICMIAVFVIAGAKKEEASREQVAPQKVVKVGFLQALSGPDSAWVIPQLTSINIWIDQVNAAGGMEVGGEKYLVELVKIDTENVPAKALEGAKKMILEDEVAMIMQLQGAECTATAPFFLENEVVNFVVYSGDIYPDRTFTFATGQNWPLSIPMGLRYAKENFPDVKRVAWAGEDYEVSWNGRAFMRASAEALGLDIVYDKAYSVDTLDFAPIADAIMASDPDIFSPQGAFVESQMLIVKELYLRGYDGVFVHEEWPISELQAVVPDEYIEERFITQVGFIGDPIIHPVGQKLYAEWISRYGPGAPEDVGREFFWIDWAGYTYLLAWEYGAKLAGTFDGQAVRDALENAHDVPHPFGPADWWGEELYGINHILMLPQYITVIKDIGGTLRDVTVAEYDNIEWFEQGDRVDIFKKHMEEAGIMWYQK